MTYERDVEKEEQERRAQAFKMIEKLRFLREGEKIEKKEEDFDPKEIEEFVKRSKGVMQGIKQSNVNMELTRILAKSDQIEKEEIAKSKI